MADPGIADTMTEGALRSRLATMIPIKPNVWKRFVNVLALIL